MPPGRRRDRELRIPILRRSLDDQLDIGERRNFGRPTDPPDDRVALLGFELASFDRPAGRGLDPLPSARQELFGGLEHGDVDPDASDNLGDPRAHESETHHGDLLDVPRPHDLLLSDSGST